MTHCSNMSISDDLSFCEFDHINLPSSSLMKARFVLKLVFLQEFLSDLSGLVSESNSMNYIQNLKTFNQQNKRIWFDTLPNSFFKVTK